jgi:hypothetical protein
MRAFALFALLAIACDPAVVGDPVETTLDDQGTACVSDAAVAVDFQTCMSSSCDTLVDASCEATLDGEVLTITSTGTHVSQGGMCTDDCGQATVSCDLPDGWEAATSLTYGGASQAVDAVCGQL